MVDSFQISQKPLPVAFSSNDLSEDTLLNKISITVGISDPLKDLFPGV